MATKCEDTGWIDKGEKKPQEVAFSELKPLLSDAIARGLYYDAMLAAYAALQTGRANMAKELLKTGMMGGSINNPLDIERCNAEWDAKYKRDR